VAAVGAVGESEPPPPSAKAGRVTARQFCECERPTVQTENGVRFCIDCGHELEPQPMPAVDLIAGLVVQKLAHQLAGRELGQEGVLTDATIRKALGPQMLAWFERAAPDRHEDVAA
jgi:hypothetical protein